jgi:hypothetical protein
VGHVTLALGDSLGKKEASRTASVSPEIGHVVG